MSYKKINWENSPSTKTPINAENLNKMDQGIHDAHQELGKLPEWSKKETKPEYTAKEVGALPDTTVIPKKTSDLENDSGFIAKDTKDLVNYYTKREMDLLKANAILSKSTGETISITDAAPVPPLNIIPYGKSTQKAYEGNQLLDVSKATTYSDHLKVDSDGWMTVTIDNSSGTSILYIGVAIPVSDLLETGKQYLSVCEVKSNTLGYAEIISPNTTNNKSQFSAGQALSAGYTGTSFKVVTTRDDFSDCKTMTRTTLRADAGVSGSITFRLSIIEDTTVTADTFVYEPFVGGEQSPSINYPQEVVPIGASGSVTEKVLTHQLLNFSNFHQTQSTVEILDNGKTITITGSSAYAHAPFTLEPKLFAGKSIYLRGDIEKASTNVGVSSIQLYGKTNSGKSVYYNSAMSQPVNIAEDLSTLELRLIINNSTAVLENEETVTFKNAIASYNDAEWEPYTEQPMTYQTPNGLHGIPLGKTIPSVIANSPIHMRGVYWDKVEQQYYIGNTKNENGKDVQRIVELGVSDFNTVLVSGDSNWYDSDISYSYEIKNQKDGKAAIEQSGAFEKCTHFTGYHFNNFYGKAVENGCLIGHNYIVVNISKSLGICTTRDEFRQYCIDNNVKFYKILANPIVTDTSEEELAQFNALRMNYPNTTIVNDAGAYTEVEYVADTQEHIKQNYAPRSEIQEMKDQIAELQALMVNNS